MGEKERDVVVVTGCSTGIGRAIAVKLCQDGYRVFAGVRKLEDADPLVTEAGEHLSPLLLDVTDAAAIEGAVAQVAEAVGTEGRLAGLINNAGIAVYGPLELLPIDTLRQQFEVNVIGHVAVTQAFVPLLRASRGRVIMIGSSSGFLTPPFLGPYASSKCALESLTDAFRRELSPWGIDVVIMQPGAVITPLWDKSIGHGDTWFEALPETLRRLYEQGFGAMRKLFLDKSGRGIPVEKLANKVAEVLVQKKSPRARYPMGTDTFGYIMMDKLPPKMVDYMLATSLGHTEKNVK